MHSPRTRPQSRNLKDAVAAGLTSVPKIKKRSYNSGDGSSAAVRGGRGRGRGSGPYGSLQPPPPSEPEFGWQQKHKLRSQPEGGDDDGYGYGDALEQEDFVAGFDDGGSDVDAVGFEGGWGGGQEEQERYSSDTGEQA